MRLRRELEKLLITTNKFILAKNENNDEIIFDTLYKHHKDILFLYRRRQIFRGELNINNPNIIKIYLKNISHIYKHGNGEYTISYINRNDFKFKFMS